ncbi:AsmA-like C-terminal region-containing protein [Flavobacterium sp.]|uniref:AsmA family protein n=1 Tax=Flavobacterium sp. TaxID=239 RepID=UPI0011F6B330|nr:AsmA family protein [Flavobacterium sp.]RZJ73784.1 MAG: AsmA family protein [Flavobacterium sp.]
MLESEHNKIQIETKKPKRKWWKIALFSVLGIVGLFILTIIGVFLYIENNKDEVLAKVTAQLNENLDGELKIGDLKPEFFSNFPRVSLRLTNVSLHDKKFSEHKHELLRAGKIDVTVNLFSLLKGTINIRKIAIGDANIDIYVAPDGYTNTSVFKKKEKSKSDGSGADLQFQEFALDNVKFIVSNQMRKKLHHYEIATFEGKVDPKGDGWNAQITYEILAKSMSFNTDRGSFIGNKKLVGNFDITANGLGVYKLSEQPIKIGEENFTLFANFDFSDGKSQYGIHVRNKSIRWKGASVLLADNIKEKLDMFDFAKPIEVSCDLEGDFDADEDPLIYVQAKVRHNELQTPGGTIFDCNFDGVFANNYDKKKPKTDANSVILLRNMTGNYGEVPFSMPVISIINLDAPYAKGKFVSNFDIPKLNSVIDKDLIAFNKGRADIAVDFVSDVVNYKLAKPRIMGKVEIKNADLVYTQRNLKFQDVSINLDFDSRDLFIRNIHIKSAKSDVIMDGKVLNFLNLYYNSPEKIVLNWNVYSKELHVGEFLGMVSGRAKAVKKTKKKGNFTSEIDELLEKSQMRMAMKIDKLYYKKFVGTNATAIAEISETNIGLKNLGMRHSGGMMRINGNLARSSNGSRYDFKAVVADVNVREFFRSFDNFGMQSLKAENISGKLSLDVELKGFLNKDYSMNQKSMDGKANFAMADGQLLNFEPIQSIGKLAFRRRNVNEIAFRDLKGNIRIKGEKIEIEPMKINSSVLNLDVAGIYSLGAGTDLRMDVPLRNPKKDENITDAEELEERRHRGIVLHLQAADDPKTGKVKISLKSKGKESEN